MRSADASSSSLDFILTTLSGFRRPFLLSLGGLGLRSLSKHSPAAYLSSRSSCIQLCKELDPQHTWEVDDASSSVHNAVQQVNHLAIHDTVITDPVPFGLQQRVLSSMIDDGSLKQLTDPDLASLGSRAHMSLSGLDGAGT